MRINPTAVYLTDNGAAYCGEHLGASAKATGRDISGQEIMEVTPALARELADEGQEGVIQCEHPKCGRAASLLHKAGV